MDTDMKPGIVLPDVPDFNAGEWQRKFACEHIL